MPDEDLLRRAYETLQGYYELGCEVRDEPLVRFVRNVDAPRIYDVNFAAFVRAGTRDEIASVLDRADDLFDGLPHRVFHSDPWTPRRSKRNSRSKASRSGRAPTSARE